MTTIFVKLDNPCMMLSFKKVMSIKYCASYTRLPNESYQNKSELYYFLKTAVISQIVLTKKVKIIRES